MHEPQYYDVSHLVVPLTALLCVRRGVDGLLLRLYEPILFRALASANASVRCNSLHALSAAFPLQVPPQPEIQLLHQHSPAALGSLRASAFRNTVKRTSATVVVVTQYVCHNTAIITDASAFLASAQDPELEATEVDELLTRQFGLLGDCLDDPVPAVRRAAASVTCSLLNVWWELVPSATAAQFLKRLAGLAFDSTRLAPLVYTRPCIHAQHALKA